MSITSVGPPVDDLIRQEEADDDADRQRIKLLQQQIELVKHKIEILQRRIDDCEHRISVRNSRDARSRVEQHTEFLQRQQERMIEHLLSRR